jgi:raffinose/stachyose/melibiose transport system permease protein
MFANTLIHSDEWKTVTVGMPSFAGQYMTELGIMLAASTMVVIPVVTLFFFLQRFIVRGLTAGAVKG